MYLVCLFEIQLILKSYFSFSVFLEFCKCSKQFSEILIGAMEPSRSTYHCEVLKMFACLHHFLVGICFSPPASCLVSSQEPPTRQWAGVFSALVMEFFRKPCLLGACAVWGGFPPSYLFALSVEFHLWAFGLVSNVQCFVFTPKSLRVHSVLGCSSWPFQGSLALTRLGALLLCGF